MNKSNKLLVGILAFVVVCVVGYALFSETITVTGTATAKGDFSITTTCENGISSIFGDDVFSSESQYDLSVSAEGGYENDSCSVLGNDVSFTTSLKYPGSARYFTIKATNTGSIPATFDTAEADEYGFGTTFSACTKDEQGISAGCEEKLKGKYNFFENIIAGFSDKDGIYYANYDDVSSFFDENTGLPVLESGESIYLIAGLYWDERDVSNNFADYTFNFSTKLPFVQITAN